MTTPGQAAKYWAREHPEAEGILTVKATTPAGRGGWKLKTKRTRFYIQDGRARGMGRRKNPEDYDDSWDRYLQNGRCYHCGRLFLEHVLRTRYVLNPNAGQPVTLSYIPPDRDVRLFRYCVATLCPDCCHDDVLTYSEFVRLGYQAELTSNPVELHLEWITASMDVPELGTIGAY